MNLVIKTKMMDTVSDDLVWMSERLEYLESELECPTWMITPMSRVRYTSERNRLLRVMKSLEMQVYINVED